MIARAGSGWQIILADLSLILFLTTAAALSSVVEQPPARAIAPSPQSEPLAIYRAESSAPPVDEWLGVQAGDPRQQLTITARYAPGGQTEAVTQATQLARRAGEQGLRARIVAEPGAPGLSATLAYDTPDTTASTKENSP